MGGRTRSLPSSVRKMRRDPGQADAAIGARKFSELQSKIGNHLMGMGGPPVPGSPRPSITGAGDDGKASRPSVSKRASTGSDGKRKSIGKLATPKGFELLLQRQVVEKRPSGTEPPLLPKRKSEERNSARRMTEPPKENRESMPERKQARNSLGALRSALQNNLKLNVQRKPSMLQQPVRNESPDSMGTDKRRSKKSASLRKSPGPEESAPPRRSAVRHSDQDQGQIRELKEALRQGNSKTAEKLIKAGVGANQPGLLDLALAGRCPVHVGELLLEHGGALEELNTDAAESTENLLHTAANHGNAGWVELFIKFGFGTNSRDAQQRTPLHVAHPSCFEVLLKHGADPNAVDIDLKTRLHNACPSGAGGKLEGSVDIVDESKTTECLQVADIKLLQRFGAKVTSRDTVGNTPLHEAAQRGCPTCLSSLIKCKAKVNVKNKQKQTPLHLAARRGHSACVQLLLKRKAKKNTRDDQGKWPLFYAVAGGHVECLELLLKHRANANLATKKDKKMLLHIAVIEKQTECIPVLLSQKHVKLDARCKGKDALGHDWIGTPLALAALSVYYEGIELLVNAGADVNACNKGGRHLLHTIADQQVIKSISKGPDGITSVPVPSKDLENRANCAAILLKNKARIDCRDSKARTPLHFAAMHGNTELADLLLGKSADTNVKDVEGRTPLHWAAMFDRISCAQSLVNAEAPLEAQDNELMTPLHLAVKEKHSATAVILIEHGADVNATTRSKSTPLHYTTDPVLMKFLIISGADCEARDSAGSTPLFEAVDVDTAGHTKLVDALLSQKVDVNVVRNSLTPLHVAVARQCVPCVKRILEAKPDLDARNEALESVLHTAARLKNEQLVRLLLEGGADPHAVDKKNRTPAQRTNKACLAILVAHGARRPTLFDRLKAF